MKSAEFLTPQSSYLHIVDVQQSLMRQIDRAEEVVRKCQLMLAVARILDMRIIANTQYKKGLGLYVDTLEELAAGIPRPDKVEFNALANKETSLLVERMPPAVTNVILVGVETHICIYQTAVGVLQRGMRPWIVADAVSSRSSEYHHAGIERLKALGAAVGPAEMLVYELLGKAGTAEFKQVLPLILDQG